MGKLTACPHCQGLLPARVLTCPHCDASVTKPASVVDKLTRTLLTVTTGSALSVTLMACYGGPPCEDGTDVDGDGYSRDGTCTVFDCNDADDTIFPGADDVEGDGIDQNCDGVDGVALTDGGVSDGGIDDDGGTDDAGIDDAGVSDAG